ncbi:MAG: type II toxin-antitoxin system RelE family toxin [Verrucomicrobiota bacterium]
MAVYKIEIKRSAAKELEKIRGKTRERIVEKIRSLADDPRPIHAKKLSGEEKYRIRIGDYRVLFKVNDLVVTVVVVKIGHRRDVYRK